MKEKKMQNPVKGRKIVWPGQIICGGGVFGLMTWCWREKATHSCSSMTYRWPEKFFKKKKEKKKKKLFKYSWLNQHSSTLTENEAAAVWDVIQEFIQLSASQHPYNVDSAGCRFIFPTSRERTLLSLWSLPPI